MVGTDLGSEESRIDDAARARSELLRLRTHFAGDPEQLARVDDLAHLITERIEIERRATEAARVGGTAAARDVMAASNWSRGRAEVRSVTSAILADARREQKDREEHYDLSIRRETIAFATAIALMFGTFLFLLNQLRVSQRAREEAERAKDLADERLAENRRLLAVAQRGELLYREMARNFPNGAINLFDHDLRFLVFGGTQLALKRDPESAVGHTLAEILPPEVVAQIEPVHRDALRGVDGRVEVVIEGRTLVIRARPVRDETGAVIMGIGMSQDVTEQRALRAQVALSSRLASLGTLVAGVAHEVNNPLAGTISSLASAVDEQRALAARIRGERSTDRETLALAADAVVEILLDAQMGAGRISQIVKDLLLFGRPNPMRTRVRLGDVATASMRWLPASVGRAATVQVDDLGAPDVHASSGQLEQVVVNLVTNAAFAIPEGRRGEVSIRIFTSASGGAVLEVKDNGRGIDAATMERIFDPFFTTREVGQGMGLGLPICHVIVSAHGGTLTGVSVVGEGSTFRVELPSSETVE
jgi:signal transduction histidine kinase